MATTVVVLGCMMSLAFSSPTIISDGDNIPLDGQWTATSTTKACTGMSSSTYQCEDDQEAQALSMAGSVPGDVITDLQRARHVSDPYKELGFLTEASLWADGTVWTYETFFDPLPGAPTSILLVFEGIKTGATVYINGQVIGTVSGQFTRYVFELEPSNERSSLAVRFNSSVDDEGRFMPCTGGWDWAPVTNTFRVSPSVGKTKTFSFGIWRSVYLVPVAAGSVAIEYVTPVTSYLGSYPAHRLVDGHHGGFEVNVTAHLWAPQAVQGDLVVSGSWNTKPAIVSVAASIPTGRSAVSVILTATADQIQLWWPNGLGSQPLYNITASFGSTTASRRVGFRVPALVTMNDSNPEYVTGNATAEGSDTFGMFFRVNGAPIYARGANVVPMEEMEGRMTDAAHRQLVNSAADARMNMIRVWGGGIFYPEAFYDQCDERGILLYHDLIFAGQNHSAIGVSNATLIAEIRHQVRRLSHHASIVLFDGANEIIVNRSGPTTVFSDVVLTTVAREDPSVILWPSSPSAGWLSGVDRLYGASTIGNSSSSPLVPLVGKHPHIWDAGNERHGPYTAGVALEFPTICNDPWSQSPTYNPQMPITYLMPEVTGVQFPSIFTSEFGVAGMSSFESMQATLLPEHYGLHGGQSPPDSCPKDVYVLRNCTGTNPMAQRNWACDNIIWSVFGNAWLNSTGEDAFKAQLYQCLVAQALTLKQAIEAKRSTNELGLLIWQLNDIWPTGSWGSLEYGTASGLTPGQVIGGRWKPVHHMYEASLFRDVIASCGILKNGTASCFVRNDRAGEPFQGTVTMTTVTLFTGQTATWLVQNVSLPPGPASTLWIMAPAGKLPNGSTTALISTVTDAVTATTESSHTVLLAPPSQMMLRTNVTVNLTVAPSISPDGSIAVSIKADQVAAFVTLTTLAQGRFSENCILLLPLEPAILKFIPFGQPQQALQFLKNSTRVEHAALYARGP